MPRGAGGVNDGEIAVASNEELHAATLNGKRLLALWNALPGIEKRKKVGDRDALIDQLWSAIETLPGPEPQPTRCARRIRTSRLQCLPAVVWIQNRRRLARVLASRNIVD